MEFQPQHSCHFYYLFYQSNLHLEHSVTTSNLEKVFFLIFFLFSVTFTQKGQKMLWENRKETRFQNSADHLVLLGKTYKSG